MVKKCIICGKEFQGKSNSSRYRSDECRNTPLYTDEINGEQYGHLTVTNAFRKKKVNSTLSANAAAEMSVQFGMTVYYPGNYFLRMRK